MNVNDYNSLTIMLLLMYKYIIMYLHDVNHFSAQ